LARNQRKSMINFLTESYPQLQFFWEEIRDLADIP
jgi:hypothetical protein